MKPVVSAMNAWTCTIISAFGIVILSVIASLFAKDHHSMTGSTEDPDNGPEVAATIWAAVVIYAVFFVFCFFQGILHRQQARRGAIILS